MNPETHPADRAVNRPLALTSPLMKGPDVHQLQLSLAAELAHYKISWLPVNPDGRFGPQTLHAARFLSWVIGLGAGHRDAIKHGRLPQATQRLLRDPAKRSRIERTRAKRRQPRLARIRKAQSEGPAAAVAYAASFIGTTESPAGSNTGPTHHNAKGQPGGVTFWEKAWGLGACYWCLCFASYCVKFIGGAKISGNCSYSEAIRGYARNHENGFIEVAFGDVRAGDILLWCFDGSGVTDHGELAAGPIVNATSNDIGGNTSSDDSGSQSNGGGVFGKHRPIGNGQLVCAARPLYS